jgi:hypothetical protein
MNQPDFDGGKRLLARSVGAPLRVVALGVFAGGALANLVNCGGAAATGAGGSAWSASSVSATTSTTSAGGGGAASSSGTGGNAPKCTEITVDDMAFTGPYFEADNLYDGTPTPALGGAAKDIFSLQVKYPYSGAMGVVDLAKEAKFSACTTCLYALEDCDDATGTCGKYYFQASGKFDYGASTVPKIVGAATDVTLVESTFDDTSGEFIPVPQGGCLHVAKIPFNIQAPKGWTCAADKWFGGAGNGCDCNCGAGDWDCFAKPAEALKGCAATDIACGGGGTCVPAAWKCSPLAFGNSDGCECGCGAKDPDCADATKASCDFCDAQGSCDTVMCVDPASKIDATNNAICN